MKTLYTDIDIRFTIENVSIRALNIVFERFTRTIPSHSHGNNCYEIHYIPFGYGKLNVEGKYYDIVPNTLFVTGPHVEHAQTPLKEDPMQEYCVYVKLNHLSDRNKTPSPVMETFMSQPFWFGNDSQDIFILMKQLFTELEHHYIGYQEQVKLLLAQLLISITRNYEHCRYSRTNFAYNNLSNSKSVIIEEYFLYEYQNLSLSDLADKIKLSPRQTQRLLQEYYGKSFHQKKAEARMSAAAILLSDLDRSITSIAEALGYSSAEHFSNAFRTYYGTSPRNYRKTNCTPSINLP